MYVTSHQRHNQALLAPSRKDEKAIVNLIRGLQDYSELLRADESQKPSAGMIQGMSDIARGLHKLIQQGPLGRLDRGLLEAALAPFIVEPPAGTLSLVHDQDDAPLEFSAAESAPALDAKPRKAALPV